MNEVALTIRDEQRALAPSARDLVAIAFRRRRVATITFAGVVLGALLCALLMPKSYEANMKVLVTHDRADAVVTPVAAAPQMLRMEAVSEEDLNTEVQLMKSRDLLEKVALTCGLDRRRSWISRWLHPAGQPDLRRAVEKLDSDLAASPVKKSNMIQISYRSGDPQLAQRVLATVSELYLQKHVAVHRPPGASEFFEKQAEQFGKELADAEGRLAQFSKEKGVVVAQTERENALQKANEFEAMLHQTNSSVRELDKRVADLRAQIAASPRRIVTADENADAQLITQLRTQLTTLELKRTELLAKYDPQYRPVKDLEAQIAQVRDEIEAEEKAPVRKVTTDNNPTTLLLYSELAKAKADYASATARGSALQRMVAQYHDNAMKLRSREIQEQDLTRAVKAKEQEYLLYLNKRDEARISDALDSKHIVNVSVAEAPTVPYFPVHSGVWVVLIGFCLACIASTVSVIASEQIDHRLRTPRDIEAYLEMPALVALPKAEQ